MDTYTPKQTAVGYRREGKPYASDVFSKVAVHIDYHLKPVAIWRLKRSNTDRRGLFTVEISDGGDFSPILTEIDRLFAEIPKDIVPYNNRHKYKLRVRYDGEHGTYTSKPVEFKNPAQKEDLGYASEMFRRQYITLRNYSGVKGQLLKKRLTGKACTRCVDLTINVPANTNCPECFGTGFTGGYYDGVDLYMELHSAPNPTVVNDPSVGAIEPGNIIQTLTTQEHWIEKDDIWVSSTDGTRYVIQELAPAVVYKDMVIAMQVVLRKMDMGAAGGKGPELNDKLPITKPIVFRGV